MGWFRHPKTTQERRRWFADRPEVKLRHAREPKALPNVWDDLWRQVERCWKSQRKTKWRKPTER